METELISERSLDISEIKPVRVLVVDDSAYLRKAISEILNRHPAIQVAGTARNGNDALEKVEELNPDVVVLDLFMPELDGIGFLVEQMQRRALPVVVCSIADEGGEKIVAAMDAGALEFVQKPTSRSNEKVYDIADDLVEKVLLAATVPAKKIPSTVAAASRREAAPRSYSASTPPGPIDALVIGISTGGPQALRYLIPKLPAGFPIPVAIVLHMPPGYTGPFAQKLDEISQVEVVEAKDGLEMTPGRVILGQAGRHLGFHRTGDGKVVSKLTTEPVKTLHKPSVDVLFRSAADIYKQRLLGIVMTGMGSDGLEGAAWIKAMGGRILTEAEETCIIYGMPRSVDEVGLSDRSVPLYELPAQILKEIQWRS